MARGLNFWYAPTLLYILTPSYSNVPEYPQFNIKELSLKIEALFTLLHLILYSRFVLAVGLLDYGGCKITPTYTGRCLRCIFHLYCNDLPLPSKYDLCTQMPSYPSLRVLGFLGT